MEVQIKNWSQTSICLIEFFVGLGKCKVDREAFTFTSMPPDVKTQFGLSKTGELIASMPLHDVRISGDTLALDNSTGTLILRGNNGEYRYTVPPAIWKRHHTA